MADDKACIRSYCLIFQMKDSLTYPSFATGTRLVRFQLIFLLARMAMARIMKRPMLPIAEKGIPTGLGQKKTIRDQQS